MDDIKKHVNYMATYDALIDNAWTLEQEKLFVVQTMYNLYK